MGETLNFFIAFISSRWGFDHLCLQAQWGLLWICITDEMFDCTNRPVLVGRAQTTDSVVVVFGPLFVVNCL